MPEKIPDSLFQKQQRVRPKIEDVMVDVLEGDALINAQDFLSYLRENKLTPAWGSANSWKVSYKNKGVCYIRFHGAAEYHNMDAGSWHLALFSQFDNHLNELISDESEEIQTLVRNHIDHSESCGGCMPGLDRKSVNKEFTNICAGTSIQMTNPDDQLREFAKKLIALRRDAIINNRVPKCQYIKLGDRK